LVAFLTTVLVSGYLSFHGDFFLVAGIDAHL
jgi:hypothetical protein